MSHITDIILITATEDSAVRQYEHPNVDLMCAYLGDRHGCRLEKVDSYAGGGKRMQCDVFMAAINGLSITDFLSCFYSVDWQVPQAVQLLIKNDQEELFSVYQPKT